MPLLARIFNFKEDSSIGVSAASGTQTTFNNSVFELLESEVAGIFILNLTRRFF